MSEQEPNGATDRLTRRIRGLIEDGRLKPGNRLPSIRAGAAEYGVSKNTLIGAYDALLALGYITSHQGSGFLVCDVRKRPTTEPPVNITETIDQMWLLREQLEPRYAVRVGDGRPPQEWLEGSELGRHLRPLNLRKRPIGEGYSTPYGYPPLRERLSVLLGERSIKAALPQILLTEGANHALDLVIRLLTKPGDRVMVDVPGYYPLLVKLRLASVDAVGVRRTPEGPDPDELARCAEQSGAHIFFTQSLAQNPTGNSLSLPCAHRILQVASRFGLRVIDDDAFSDLFPTSAPRLAALDQLDQVILIGTFAKTLSAGLRVGYIAASEEDIRALTDLKMLTMINSSGYIERIINDLILSGQYRRHLGRLKARITKATDLTLQTLAKLDLTAFGRPSGGYYMWAEMPPAIDEIQFAKAAAAEGIFIAPGSMFCPENKRLSAAMRLNIAFASDERFVDFYRAYNNGLTTPADCTETTDDLI